MDNRAFGITKRAALARRLTLSLFTAAVAGGFATSAQSDSSYFTPGNLVVSRSVYDNNPDTLVVGVTTLPPNGCVATLAGAAGRLKRP